MNIQELKKFAAVIGQSCDATRVDLIGGEHADEPIAADFEVTLREHENDEFNDLLARTHKARALRDSQHPDVAMMFTFGHVEPRVGLVLFENADL
ncbi:MAG: hypothetical protein EOP07_24070 [Proteobacteria bacterium]|nr:MAG: hypothetical protein EOP07_24070 [Pseudomonadota bacterium]